ncbi:MAG: ribonuclease P protein component [Bacillota bacterium]|nr:ribonuclease P protein component [Bacillota bacterium]
MLKKEILRKKDDFTLIYKKGKSIGERYIVLFYRKNNLSYNRTAFLASKKVGNSVIRNRSRRLMRESYRFLKDDLKTGYDIIFIARASMVGRKFKDVDKSVKRAVSKAKLYKGARGDVR